MILPIIIWLLFVLLIIELAHFLTYRKLLSDKVTIPFLEKNLNTYHANPYSQSMLCAENVSEGPYISMSRSVFSKWYIEDYGCVPRWSKASRMITKYWNENKPVLPTKKPLNDL